MLPGPFLPVSRGNRCLFLVESSSSFFWKPNSADVPAGTFFLPQVRSPLPFFSFLGRSKRMARGGGVGGGGGFFFGGGVFFFCWRRLLPFFAAQQLEHFGLTIFPFGGSP